MEHKHEKRDLLIAGGIGVAVLVLIWLALRNKGSTNPAAESQLSDPLSTSNNPPSYNVPPTLQLPPYNVGNAPVSGAGAGASDHCGCGSNVCGTNGSDYLSKFLQTMSVGSGITNDGGMTTLAPTTLSPISPITAPVANISAGPAANSYSVWRAKEGLDPPGAGNNNTHQRDSIPPGLTNQQQYKLYQLLNGGLFGNADIGTQNKIMAQIYDMPSSGPVAIDSGGTGNNLAATGYGYGPY